jgi:hypothetical protein
VRLTKKQFLSDSPDETGFIVVTASTPLLEKMEQYDTEPRVDAEVQLGDCTKKIYLDFNIYKDSDVQKRIEKLDVLINNLKELKDALPTLWCDAVHSAEIYKEDNKEKEDENTN